ncbi:MAG: peptidoglycan DD-metalloendopeptidase family protein [Terricaulis silvestris]
MSLHALIVPVAALLLVPLAWSGVVAGMRTLTQRDRAPHEGGAELRVLAIMLAPVLVGALCLAWASAPQPYAPPPLLADAHFFEVTAPAPTIGADVVAPSFDWFGASALALAITYAIGFAWRAARLSFAQARVARIAARARDASEVWGAGVAITDARVSAFVGPNRKVILPRVLVATLAPAQIALIIAHERGHLRRGDALAFTAFAWIDAACWFNPFVRLQTRRCRLAAELACDAAATAGAPDMRRAYAQTLIAALKHTAGDALPCAPAVFSTWIVGDHRMRIARIMEPAAPPRKRAAWGVYAAASLLAAPVFVLQLAIAQPSAVSAPQPAPSAVQPSTVFSVVPVSGRVTSPFGPRNDPDTGKPAQHTGIDFAAPEGTEIVAPAPGRVTRVAEWPAGMGKLIDIDHGNGLTTRYAHLSAFEVTEGQQVTSGQAIGRVGSTGRSSTGPHLHFEVRRNGELVDPAPLLPH